MRSAATLLLTVLLLLLAAPAGPAHAGDWVEGDGYRFRLPPEFVDIKKSKSANRDEVDQALKMVDGMLPPQLSLDMKAFVRQRGTEPDALVFVMAMHLEEELKQAAGQLTIDALERGMRDAQKQIDASGALVEISRVRRILVSAGHEALELEMNYDDPELGPLNSVRMLFVVEDTSFCMLGFQGMRKNSGEDAIFWRAIVTSFRIDERGSIMVLLMRYGPFILGGLVLLIAVVLLKRSSSRKLIRPMLSTRPGGGGGESGFSRALDGLPTYGQPGGDFREPAAEGPPAPLEAVPAPAAAAAYGERGPIKAPTIPRAAPPVAEEFAPAPTGGPSGVPRKLPEEPQAPRGMAAAPLPPPAPPAPPPPAPLHDPVVPAGDLQPPAVAERIEIDDLPAGSHMPTNVAMRKPQRSVPQADNADEVLSRLMGLGEGPDDDPAAPPAEQPPKTDGAKIQRNSDFFA